MHCRLDDLETALEVAKIVLPMYEKLFEMPYPLSKMDLVAIPDFEAGAMENWGLLLFREVTLVASKQGSSISALREVTLTIAHEMAHMVSLALMYAPRTRPSPGKGCRLHSGKTLRCGLNVCISLLSFHKMQEPSNGAEWCQGLLKQAFSQWQFALYIGGH